MKFIGLRLSILSFFIILFSFWSHTPFAFQKDSRGFPITQSPGTPFGMPSVTHPSPLGAPLITMPPLSNKLVRIPHHSHHRFFYFDYYGYPYYVTPANNNTFYYSISPLNDDTNEYDTSQPIRVNLPQGKWVFANDGEVPDQAFVYQTSNGEVSYYCRAKYKYKTYYGVLIRNEGCFVQHPLGTLRINEYEVLVSY